MASFYEQFKICADKYSDNNSILFCDNTKNVQNITYNELLDQIILISNVLEKNNVVKNTCIGILIEPNPVLIAVTLSIQKHCCPFHCFDTYFDDSNFISIAEYIGINYIFLSEPPNLIKNYASLICPILLPKFENKLELWKLNVNKSVIYKNISYIIQTSGTTGKNKIVKVRHDCIMSNVESLCNILKINHDDIIFFNTPVTFDPFIIELMLALTTGACLFVVSPIIKYNRTLLLQILFPTNQNLYSGVTFLQMAPSVFLLFSEKDIHKILCNESSLRILALGGENFPRQLFQYKDWSNKLKIYNLYGITEVSCWASIEEVKEYDKNVSLGTVLKDTLFEIRDDFGNIRNKDEGNLFIGSSKRICEIDDEKIPLNDIIYRETGDVVTFDEIANKIFYVGRKYNNIKRLGHKVNLTQIEQSIYDKAQLTSVCVWDKIKSKLIMFIILQEADNIVKNKIIDKLRIKLLRCLSSASMPDIIEIIPAIPLTANGKTDRNCLLQIVNLNTAYSNLTPVVIFQNLWSKYFGMSKKELDAQKINSFLNMGGNSIVAIQMISEYDSLVNNSYSGDLMATLLDPNKNYTDYLNFINTQKIEDVKSFTESKLPISKYTKMYTLSSPLKNNYQINIGWLFNLDACVDSSPVHFIHPRLGHQIAIGSHGQKFVILNIDGKLISENILPDAVEGSACFINNEIAIIGCNNGIIYFIDVETGKIINQYVTNSSIKCTPICIENDRIIFGSYDKNLYCLNSEGGLKWKFTINESIKSNVVTKEHNSYVATINGSYFCICIKTGKLKWKQKSNTPVFGSPCIIEAENLIIWADVKGHVNCFDCDNGDKLWTYEASGFIYSSLHKIKKRILFSCFDHNVYCLDCTRNGCMEVYKINIGAQISTTPFVFNIFNTTFVLAINNKGLLHLIDFESTILQQTFQLPAEVFSSPIVVDNKIFVGCRDNNVYCLELKINT